MAIQFDSHFINKIISVIDTDLSDPLHVYLYQGTMPDETAIDSYDPSNYTANQLGFVSIPATALSIRSDSDQTGSGQELYLAAGPFQFSASGTGTVTWCALTNDDVNAHKTIFCEPSLTNDNGVVHLESLSVVANTSYYMLDISLGARYFS